MPATEVVMSFINVNLNDVEDQSGDVHPEGRTNLRIVGSEVRETKAKDGSYINWRLEVIDSDNKRPIWLANSLKVQALWNLKNLYKACMGDTFNPEGFDTTDLHGCEFSGVVSIEEYQGAKTNRVEGPYKAIAK
jgi:hypothetical protein